MKCTLLEMFMYRRYREIHGVIQQCLRSYPVEAKGHVGLARKMSNPNVARHETQAAQQPFCIYVSNIQQDTVQHLDPYDRTYCVSQDEVAPLPPIPIPLGKKVHYEQ